MHVFNKYLANFIIIVIYIGLIFLMNVIGIIIIFFYDTNHLWRIIQVAEPKLSHINDKILVTTRAITKSRIEFLSISTPINS